MTRDRRRLLALLALAWMLAAPVFAQGPQSRREAMLWIGHDDLMETMDGPAGRRGVLAGIARRGYTGVCIEAQGADGARTFADRDGSRILASVIGDARRARMKVWLAWKPTAAYPGAPPELLQVAAVAGDTSSTLRLLRSDALEDNGPGELSPAHRDVLQQWLRDASAIGALEPDAVLLVDFGFEGPRADASPAAERAFAFHVRRSIRRWPEDVLAPGAAGSLVAAWQVWRALLLRNAVLAIKAALKTSRGTSVPIVLLTSGPYRSAGERGLNWATARGLAESGAPEDPKFSGTACGHLFDAIVVGTWLSAQTEAEAASMGYRPEFAAARMVMEAPVSGVATWTVLDARAMDPGETAARLAGRQALGEGVLVLDPGAVAAPPGHAVNAGAGGS